MSFGIPLMLLGLAGVSIPIIIHLLNRRRYQTLDWGAMQFLVISETTRRRLLLEEILLLLLRMGLIAVLVLALAAPFTDSALTRLGIPVNRDVVLIFDGSYSMNFAGSDRTAHERARDWAGAYLDGLTAGDSVAVLQAKQQVVPLLGELSQDLDRARQAIAQLPPPRGGVDWPLAVQEAHKLLTRGQHAQQEIIILSDGQRFGWADESSLLRWELLGKFRTQQAHEPRLWVVNLDPDRPSDPPNWSLAPLTASRAVASAGQQILFRTALELHGQSDYKPPYRLRLEVDGQPVKNLDAPATAELVKGQIPLSFSHRFTAPGSHLISVLVEPDPPEGQRPAKYRVKDQLPGDNRQDFALEVLPVLPVLLVDGDTSLAPRHRGTDFLRDALAPARDPTPVVRVKVVSIQQFEPAQLTSDMGPEPGTKPRVLILANVARLLTQQQEAVTQFLAGGGGVLVTLGDRVDARHYNDQLFHGGDSWLPAYLQDLAGDEAKPEQAANPLPSSFFHPAVELFHETAAGGLAEARFPRWYRVTTPGRTAAGVPIALLSSRDPWLVERSFRAGRVLLSTVPLDNSWRSNLPELPAFAPLIHELVYYLAGARAATYNLAPGQPLRYQAQPDEPLAKLVLQPPDGAARPLVYENEADAQGYPAQVLQQPTGPVVVCDQTRETGVYRLTTGGQRTVYYVALPDPRESDLTPCNEVDRTRVSKLLPMTYENDRANMVRAEQHTSQRVDLWWWFLLGLIGLLCGEVWLTRRITRGR
jgi:hypothetical protein